MKNPIEKLKNFKRVSVMGSNHFIVVFENGNIFQSYDSMIAIKVNGIMHLTSKWNYSPTTGRYRNTYLGETKKETQNNIDNGTYKLIS